MGGIAFARGSCFTGSLRPADGIYLPTLARSPATERDYWLINVAVDPAFDRLRSRPEFSAILHGVGLPELHFTH
jgi:hypothetical protein